MVTERRKRLEAQSKLLSLPAARVHRGVSAAVVVVVVVVVTCPN